jgi:DNA-binding NarL/FixJ family response regulator
MIFRTPAAQISIAIAGQPALRTECESILRRQKEISIVRSVATQADLLQAVIQLTPDVALIEETLVHNIRRALLASIKKLSPSTKAILLCVNANPAAILGALTESARGCLETRDAPSHLVKSIHAVHQGEIWVSRAVLTLAVTRLAEQSHQSGLAPSVNTSLMACSLSGTKVR